MKLSETTTEAVRVAAADKGCQLLAIETAGAGRFCVVRLVLEKADGASVTVEDCEVVSRQVSCLLDLSEEIPHRYTLEVSSAGLDRKLYSVDDARRFVGRRIKVAADRPVQAASIEPASQAAAILSRHFAGILSRVDGDLLTVVDEENRKIYNVRFGNIRQARLDFRWPERAS